MAIVDLREHMVGNTTRGLIPLQRTTIIQKTSLHAAG